MTYSEQDYTDAYDALVEKYKATYGHDPDHGAFDDFCMRKVMAEPHVWKTPDDAALHFYFYGDAEYEE